jgi:hypothetical protein
MGEKEKMISERVAAADMFPDDATEEGRRSNGKEKTAPSSSGYPLVLEETVRLHGGKWAYLKYPQHVHEAEEAKRKLSSYKTPDEYRQSLMGKVNSCRILVDLGPVETKAGQIYTIDAESKEAIKDAWSELYWAIRDAVIHTRMVPLKLTEQEKAAKRDQYADAQNDAAFRSFVQGLIGDQDALH